MREKEQTQWREKTEEEPHERKLLKTWKMTDRYGHVFRFECEGQEQASEWARKQLTVMGFVYPKDLVSVEEDK